MKIDGKCHCGNLAYRAELDPERVTICHCTDCQEMSGSAYRVNAYVDAASLSMSGTPALYERTAESGRKRIHNFCPRCGTDIYSTGTGDRAKILSLRTGTIRQRGELKPSRQIFCGSMMEWTEDIRDIPRFEKSGT